MRNNITFIFATFLLLLSGSIKAEESVVNKQISHTDTVHSATIDVKYEKEDHSGLIWKDELKFVRILPTLDHKGIRISLPNSDPAKVIIMDKKGKKKLKTVLYVAPAVIDISDLKKGTYQLLLQIHQEIVVKEFRK